MSQEKARWHRAALRARALPLGRRLPACSLVRSLSATTRLPLYARFPRLHQALLQAPTRYACPLVFPAFCAKRSTPKLNLIYLFWLLIFGSDLILSVYMYYYASIYLFWLFIFGSDLIVSVYMYLCLLISFLCKKFSGVRVYIHVLCWVRSRLRW